MEADYQNIYFINGASDTKVINTSKLCVLSVVKPNANDLSLHSISNRKKKEKKLSTGDFYGTQNDGIVRTLRR